MESTNLLIDSIISIQYVLLFDEYYKKYYIYNCSVGARGVNVL